MEKYKNYKFKTTQEARKTYLEIHEAFDAIEKEFGIPSHDIIRLVNMILEKKGIAPHDIVRLMNGSLRSSAIARSNLLIIWNRLSERYDVDTVTMDYEEIGEYFNDGEIEALIRLGYLEIIDLDEELIMGLNEHFKDTGYIIQIGSVEKLAREMLDNDKVKVLAEINSKESGEFVTDRSKRVRKMFLKIHGIT